MLIKQSKGYRKDIDGLRAIAILSVFIFHAGYLPNGFLGVDIFFVISGYLITRILFLEISENRFSLANFYKKRLRRIVPLTLFFCVLSIILGYLFMLPDDYENLVQSIIATVFFSNNLLLLVTTGDYWNTINDFKPLMHTWSLGIEEQFYIIYPFLFFFFKKKKVIVCIILLLSLVSLFFYLFSTNSDYKFYVLPYRFFELSIGGIAALFLKNNVYIFRYRSLLILVLLVLLIFNFPINLTIFQIPLTCIVTAFLLISSDTTNSSSIILENKAAVGLGKISFSIYMWHQFIFAFIRYIYVQQITIEMYLFLFLLVIALSYITYKLIESPFRNKLIISNYNFFKIIITTIIIIVSLSYYINYKAGVLKDFEELNLTTTNTKKGIHNKYIKDIMLSPKKTFNTNNKIKILIGGDSFASDWANVLLESEYKNQLDIVVSGNLQKYPNLLDEANFIFFAKLTDSKASTILKKEFSYLNKVNFQKLWCVGTKNFGLNNGVFLNNKGNGYCYQRVKMKRGYLEANTCLKKEWGVKYLDIIKVLKNDKKTVPIFTPNCKFISQDTKHLTKPGAQYISSLFKSKFGLLFNQ